MIRALPINASGSSTRVKVFENIEYPPAKLYFANAANLLLQYNLKRIEPLSPRGMSGQDEQGAMEFRGEEKTYPELSEDDPLARVIPPNVCVGG